MIKQFRFHSTGYSNSSSKALTLTLDNDWQSDEVAEFLRNLDTDYPSLDSVKDFADKHGVRYREG